jgi:hypothetical protein
MRRALLALMVLGVTVAVLAPGAFAATDVQVQATFTEPEFSKSCPFADTFCGSGQVLPFGHATETIQFGGGCGGGCDLRTINLAAGSLVAEEGFSDPTCPGRCRLRGRGGPEGGTLTDTIVTGTGVFEGATGTLIGTVFTAGNTSLIKLSGTITLAGT